MESIDIQKFPYLSSPSTAKLFKTLKRNGIEARFVGGCVREAMLGNSAHDIDIAVNTTPEIVTNVLEKAGIKVIPTGIDHGTLTVVIDSQVFEVTSLRSDIKTDGRHAAVSFGASWFEDAQRRDFTINAMYLSINGTMYDPCDGQSDLERGNVKFIGQAAKRIQEDYLRILRFFRFHSRFGSKKFDQEAITAIRANLGGLNHISRERIRMELMKILVTENSKLALDMMQKTGVADVILSGGIELGDYSSITKLEAELGITPSHLRRLYIILPKSLELRNLAKQLRLTKKEQNWFTKVSTAIDDSAYTRPAHYQLYYFDTALAIDINMIAKANSWVNELNNIIAAAPSWSRPKLPITGNDLRSLASGKQIGALLKSVESWWVERRFQPNYDECLSRAKVIANYKNSL